MTALAGASIARATTLTVTTLNDSGPGSLRQTIADAASGDTITFSVKGTITLTSGALIINRDLIIEGPGPNKLEISGNHASRVFVIPNGNVTLAGVTIRDGLADGSSPIYASTGGGILNFARLTLSYVVVSDNQALGNAGQSFWDLLFGFGQGGGVANFGTLAATDSAFTGNLARGGDGSSGDFAPGDAGGGALVSWGDMHVLGSQFTDNACQGGSGSSGNFAGCVFGGAIGNFGSLSIATSTFSRNQAIAGNANIGSNSGFAFSGAIHTETFFGPASLEVQDSQFDHNQAIGGNDNRGLFSGSAMGGAIHFNNAPGTISGCRLDHNQALGGAGGPGAEGGWGNGGGVNNYQGVFTFDSSTVITKNKATTSNDNVVP